MFALKMRTRHDPRAARKWSHSHWHCEPQPTDSDEAVAYVPSLLRRAWKNSVKEILSL